MFGTLRRRFALSHVLPLLVVIPLMGIALVYVLETRILLSTLSNELEGEALLIAQMTQAKDGIWQDANKAQVFVDGLDPRLTPRVMLLDTKGTLLASSDASDGARLGQPLEELDLTTVLEGEIHKRTKYSQQMQQEIVDVMVPVMGPERMVLGIVRLSHQYSSVLDDFLRLRYVIGGVLLGGALMGAALGVGLALNMERPLQQMTQAVFELARGKQLDRLPEKGPREIRDLLGAVNTLVERLRSLEQARRQLLANLVHELGRPLGALRAAVDALLAGADQDTALRRELLEGIGEEVDRLGNLVDDLAGLHSQVLGTLELHLQPVDLGDWLIQSLGPWRADAEARGLHWQTQLPSDLPELMIDVDRLGQALGNLLSNAIKYTPPGGTVSMSAGAARTEAWIAVSDTGPGIPPEERELIFTPFYRSQAGRRFPQGMGLGLSIALTLVTAHGGRLVLDSVGGTGSRFTIWLPLTS
jgi:two-component system sensor histidine kinase BaeS